MLKGNRLGLVVGALCILLVGVDLMRSAALGSQASDLVRSDDAPRVVAISAYAAGNGYSFTHHVYRQWSDGTMEFRIGSPNQYGMTWNPWTRMPD